MKDWLNRETSGSVNTPSQGLRDKEWRRARRGGGANWPHEAESIGRASLAIGRSAQVRLQPFDTCIPRAFLMPRDQPVCPARPTACLLACRRSARNTNEKKKKKKKNQPGRSVGLINRLSRIRFSRERRWGHIDDGAKKDETRTRTRGESTHRGERRLHNRLFRCTGESRRCRGERKREGERYLAHGIARSNFDVRR